MKWKPEPRAWRTVRWMLIDVLLIIASYTLAYTVRALVSPVEYINSFGFILASTVIIVASLYLHGIYKRLWQRTSGHHSVVILRAMFVAFVVQWVLDLLIQPRPMPLSILSAGALMTTGALVAVRYRSRLLSGLTWRWIAITRGELPNQKPKESRTRVLIVGAGESGEYAARRLLHSGNANHHHVIGFIDDDRDKLGMYVEGRPILGMRTDIPKVVNDQEIDVIVLAIHNIEGAEFREILSFCEATKARIKLVPDLKALMDTTDPRIVLRDVTPEDLIGRSIITRHEAVDLAPVTGKRIMVTGASGSIGSELSRQIATYDPVKLILIDNNESALHDLHVDLTAKHDELDIEHILLDVTMRDRVDAIFDEQCPDVVFHAAAYKHVPLLQKYPEEALRVNVLGTLNIAEAARDCGAERFVLISTDKAVKPTNVMGASKRLCELIMHMLSDQKGHKTRFTAVRFGNVLGSRGSVVPTFTRQIETGGPVTVTHKDMKRYFMSISEAVNLVIHAACMTDGDDIFILRMGEEVPIVDIAERMIRLRGLRPYTDIKIEFTGVRSGEKLNEELYDDAENTESTIHPHIMKVSGWTVRCDPELFEGQVKQLLGKGFKSADSALTELESLLIVQPRYQTDQNGAD